MIRSVAIFTDSGRLIVKWSATETTVDYTLLSGLLAAIGTLSQSLGIGKPGIINFEDQKIIFVKHVELPELNFVAEFSEDSDIDVCKNLLNYLSEWFLTTYGRFTDEELEGDIRKFKDIPETIQNFFEAKLDQLLSRLNPYIKDVNVYLIGSGGNLLFSVPPSESASLSLDLLNQFLSDINLEELRTFSGTFRNGYLRLYTFSDSRRDDKFQLLVKVNDPSKKTLATKIRSIIKEYQDYIFTFFWQLPLIDSQIRSLARKSILSWLESIKVDVENVRVDWNVLINPLQRIKADALVTFIPKAIDQTRQLEERVGIVNVLRLQVPCTKSELIVQLKRIETIGNHMKALPAFLAIFSPRGFTSEAASYLQTRTRISIKNRLMPVYLLEPKK